MKCEPSRKLRRKRRKTWKAGSGLLLFLSITCVMGNIVHVILINLEFAYGNRVLCKAPYKKKKKKKKKPNGLWNITLGVGQITLYNVYSIRFFEWNLENERIDYVHCTR